jgi:hypothetical protein
VRCIAETTEVVPLLLTWMPDITVVVTAAAAEEIALALDLGNAPRPPTATIGAAARTAPAAHLPVAAAIEAAAAVAVVAVATLILGTVLGVPQGLLAVLAVATCMAEAPLLLPVAAAAAAEEVVSMVAVVAVVVATMLMEDLKSLRC